MRTIRRSYLVTGGCGFVGVNLVPKLLASGASVRVFDDLSVGKRDDIAAFDVELQHGDVRDSQAVNEACQDMEAVIHLAAHTRVVESLSDPQLNFDINAVGTFNVLQACVKSGVKKLIFASTGGAILGEQIPPVHEGMAPRPLSPYGASKLVGEGYCSAFYGSFGLDTTALRFSNVYGPYSYRKGSVVAHFFKSILQGEPLIVYGDGQQTRDFIYVGDIVNAILLADQANVPGEVFQIASGKGTSVSTLISALQKLCFDRTIEVRHEPARAGEILHNHCRIDKARAMLGYAPAVDLDEGLARTWDWFKLSSRT